MLIEHLKAANIMTFLNSFLAIDFLSFITKRLPTIGMLFRHSMSLLGAITYLLKESSIKGRKNMHKPKVVDSFS